MFTPILLSFVTLCVIVWIYLSLKTRPSLPEMSDKIDPEVKFLYEYIQKAFHETLFENINVYPWSRQIHLRFFEENSWRFINIVEFFEKSVEHLIRRKSLLHAIISAIETVFVLHNDIDSNQANALLKKAAKDAPLSVYIPAKGERIDTNNMAPTGDGFRVTKVIRPGFLYPDGQSYKRALVIAMM